MPAAIPDGIFPRGAAKHPLIPKQALNYQENPSDSTLANPALKRLVDDQKIAVKNVWGDRGLASKLNSAMLERREIRNGLCPRDVSELSDKLATEPDFREGLKRRADYLNLSIETVRSHLKNIYAKMHVRSRAEAVAHYMSKRPG